MLHYSTAPFLYPNPVNGYKPALYGQRVAHGIIPIAKIAACVNSFVSSGQLILPTIASLGANVVSVGTMPGCPESH